VLVDTYLTLSNSEISTLTENFKADSQLGTLFGGTVYSGKLRGTEVTVLQLPKLAKEKISHLQEDFHQLAKYEQVLKYIVFFFV
jgi:hypothetical protein